MARFELGELGELEASEAVTQLVALLRRSIRFGAFKETSTCTFTVFGANLDESEITKEYEITGVGLRPKTLVGDDWAEDGDIFVLVVRELKDPDTEIIGVKAVKFNVRNVTLELLGVGGQPYSKPLQVHRIVPSPA